MFSKLKSCMQGTTATQQFNMWQLDSETLIGPKVQCQLKVSIATLSVPKPKPQLNFGLSLIIIIIITRWLLKPSTDDRFSSADFVGRQKSADKMADFSKQTRDFRRRTKWTTMMMRLYFYCLSTEDVENVKRTDQFGSNPGLWKGWYNSVGSCWTFHFNFFLLHICRPT